MGAVVEIWLESLIPFLQRDSRIVHCLGHMLAKSRKFWGVFFWTHLPWFYWAMHFGLSMIFDKCFRKS